MHAIRLHAFGPAENLVYEEVPDPRPGPGEALIAVEAAGVHLIDTALRAGPTATRGSLPLPELPTVPGREVAGTVAEVGEGVDAAWLGRRVSAHLGTAPGGYAERAVTSVDKLHRLPAGVSAATAVAMLGTGRMTLGILRFAELTPEDTLLVLAAAGGIGTLLVQYAKHRGARVVGAAGGPAKVEAVAKLGAGLAVDYTRPDWVATIREKLGDRPFTLLCEGVGGEAAHAALDLLAPGGRHLGYGYAATGFSPEGAVALTPEELAARGISSTPVLGAALFEKIGGPENLRLLEDEALALAAEGVWVPLVQTFPLAEAAQAHRALAGRATMGKVVLVP